jgi:hypothetical protein
MSTRPPTAAEAYAAANLPGSHVRWYSSSCGRIELALTLEDAQSASHSGDCEADVEELMRAPYILEQLARISSDIAQEVATESGRNDYGHGDADNTDHHANLRFVLWMACGDIVENSK